MSDADLQAMLDAVLVKEDSFLAAMSAKDKAAAALAAAKDAAAKAIAAAADDDAAAQAGVDSSRADRDVSILALEAALEALKV